MQLYAVDTDTMEYLVANRW